MRLAPLASSFAFALIGCADNSVERSFELQAVPLSDLSDLTIKIRFSRESSSDIALPARKGDLFVGFEFLPPVQLGSERPDNDGRSICAQLGDDFRATFAGLEATISRGQWEPAGGDGPLYCQRPGLEFTIPQALQVPEAVLGLGDASRSLSIPLGDLLLPRVAALVDGDPQVHPGQAVALTWSPVSDLDALPLTNLTFRDADGLTVRGLSSALSRVDDQLVFTVPQATLTGSLVVELRGEDLAGPGYTVQISQIATHAVVVTP